MTGVRFQEDCRGVGVEVRHVRILDAIHKILYALNVIALPVEQAPTECGADMRLGVPMCNGGVKQFLNDFVRLGNIEFLAIEMAQRHSCQAILKTLRRSSNAEEENQW